jgi:cytochrome c553
MTMAKRTMLALAVALAAAAALPAHAADVAAGQAKAKEVCGACHGADGNSKSPEFPILAGQYPDYLEKALRDYKSGARKNAIMAGFAAGMSKEDIANVAAWFSSQQSVLATAH